MLAKYYKDMTHYLMRFDHYLEMLVQNADYIQEICPNKVLDYTSHCQRDELPEECAIVAFPRSPKPHEVVDRHPWVTEHWK